MLATHYLFDALRSCELSPRVVVTSSATVYAPSDRALKETDTVRPNSPYGTSKLAQEMTVRRAWEDHGIPGVIARSFNHVGPRQSPSFVAPALARQIAEIEAGKRPPTLTMGNIESRRDVMDVRDTVRAYHAMMQSGKAGETYNVCSGKPIAVRSLVELFVKKSRVKVEIVQDPALFRPNDTPLILGDLSRLHADTGWSPQVPLEKTVDDLLAYWRSLTAIKSV